MAGGIYTWDLTRPSLGEAPAGDAGPGNLFIVDKTTLAAILTTLAPFGANNTGWKQVQLGDDTWLVQNATYTGAVWNRDSIAAAALSRTLELSGPYFRWMFAASGANPITWTEWLRLTSAGVFLPSGAGVNPSGSTSFTLGQSAPATSATTGFPYLPAMAGVPSGVPTSIAGFAPIVVDTTDNRLYFYSGGWRGVGQPSTVQVFPASGTYTTPAGVRAIVVEIVGPGGGAGGTPGSSNTSGAGAGGGYARKLIAAPLASYAVVIGTKGLGGVAGNFNGAAGSGPSTFGAVLTANAGGGGISSGGTGNGGIGGTAVGGDLNLQGENGEVYANGGHAGASFLGGRGISAIQVATGGSARANSGSGGASPFGINQAGGDGADGVCVVTEFY